MPCPSWITGNTERADDDVPPSQSRKLHEAMMNGGKKDEFVVHDEEKHGFEDPRNAVDFLKSGRSVPRCAQSGDDRGCRRRAVLSSALMLAMIGVSAREIIA